MIRDLSESLSALLTPALPAADISFERPTDQFQPAQTTVNLFLYDIRENVELRNHEPVFRRQGSETLREPPPLRLDCSYLLTAWPVGGANLALQEHRLLSDCLRHLVRFPLIPAEFLQGSLIGQRPPLPTIVARPDGLANPSEFWTALGARLRVGLTLRVTISMPMFADLIAPIVLTRQTGFTPTAGAVEEHLFQIGGRVLAPAAAMRAAATLASAANQHATLQNAADAFLFRPGDVVLLRDALVPAHVARPTILSLSGTTVTFERPLQPPSFPVGSTMRIADLAVRQDRVRLDRIGGLEPGAELTFTQGTTTESATVRAVDHATRMVTLQTGLAQPFLMDAGDPPVNVVYGVSGAHVEVVGARLRTTSRPDGRFTFVRVPRGTDTLRVTAVGFQPAGPTAIEIPAPGNQHYEVVLTPL
jgi:hypothetical protein